MSGDLTTLTKRITATLNEFAPDLEKVRPIDRRIILSQFLTTDLGADFLNGKDPSFGHLRRVRSDDPGPRHFPSDDLTSHQFASAEL